MESQVKLWKCYQLYSDVNAYSVFLGETRLFDVTYLMRISDVEIRRGTQSCNVGQIKHIGGLIVGAFSCQIIQTNWG